MKNIIWLLLLIFCFIPFNSNASHVKGGEIYWECDANGNYIFYARVYRDCSGAGTLPNNLSLFSSSAVFPGFPATLTLISTADITPSCDFATGGPQPTTACLVPNQAGSGGQGATERMIYKSLPIDLQGVPAPPAAGYTIYTTPPPSRNAPNNISCGGMTIRAKIFPFKKPGKPLANTLSKCYDNSPTFAESPVPLVITSPETYIYNNNTKDIDGDSVSFSFDEPWQSFNTSCNFLPPYNVNKPIPGDPILFSESGELIYKPVNVGKFVTCIKVTSYRCGQKIAEIYRDFQTEIIAEPANYEDNSPPTILAPFENNSLFDTTVFAGSTVKFKIDVEDLDNPSFSVSGFQNLQLMFNSEHFGNGYSDTTAGCQLPPCAMINLSEDLAGAAPTEFFNNGDALGWGYEYPGGTAEGKGSLWFYWPTACENLQATDCGPAQARTFRFVIRARDGACPAPGQTSKTISIRVLPAPEIKSPEIKTAEVLNNGDVKLSWEKPERDPVAFISHNIYTSTSKFAAFTLAASLPDFSATSYTHTGVDANNKTRLYYFVETISTCLKTVSRAQDTIQVIKANPSYNIFGGNIKVTWNPLRDPLATSSATEYKIFREYPVGSGFIEVGTTSENVYFDNLDGKACQDSVNYKITIADNAINENSVSTIGKTYISSMQPEITTTIPDQCKTTVNFNANITSGGAPPFKFEWSGDDGFKGIGNQISYDFSGPGKFEVILKVTDNADCVVEIKDTINFESAIGVSFSNDEVCFGETTNLQGNGEGGTPPYSYEWSTSSGVVGNGMELNHVFNESGDLQVTLKITDSDNCSNERTQTVFVDPCVPNSESRLHLPDAFSPNGDGNNDKFNIQAFNMKEYTFNVFNRWGERVYQTADFNEDWDGMIKGKVVKSGVYVYVLNAEGTDGQIYKLKGTITITQ
ncbi:MAG: gliding motility-associated-like protein [Sphingobacteriales bacterium]|jgi:gliding motility-associated-like protein